MHGSRSKIPSKKSRPYIYDVKFLALLGAPYIYDISRLRVKIKATCFNCTQSSTGLINHSHKCLFVRPEDDCVQLKHVALILMY
jgi:hypothetical protein